MGLIDLTRRVVEKKLDDTAKAHAPKAERVDVGLPFGARIGSLLEVPRTQIALLTGSLLTLPKSAQMPIVAASRVRLDGADDIALFRLYTDTGLDRSGAGASYLQVLCAQGNVDEIRDLAYYQFLDRTFPVTDEEQAPFRGEGFGLGQTDFEMGDEQLANIPQVAPQLAALLGGADSLRFVRDTPGGDYVKPFQAEETRMDDPIGEEGMQKRQSFMPYVRALADDKQERLLISFDNVLSMDGKPTRAAYVDYLVGLALDRSKVKVF